MSEFGSTETPTLQQESPPAKQTKTSTKRQELFKWQIRIFALS
ncbi:hypothetical protein [Arthrobacter celericrescens]|nr:hypothetical protein [Arthrobacter celericrescens]